jgi:hypothetical protein
MTARVSELFLSGDREVNHSKTSPCSTRFFQVNNIIQDQTDLCLFCQYHACNDYCLRSTKARKRKCRMGCGEEEFPMSCKAPGWKISTEDTIEKDGRGFQKLVLKRNNSRILQPSLFCLQTWRANCDVSILIYSSNPYFPFLHEIANVTDYDACKGNAAYAMEKQQIKEFTSRYSKTMISFEWV